MYASHIGKRFLEIYNREHETDYTPRAFFDEVFWPLFFDTEDIKHLMQAWQSAFFQPGYVKIAKEQSKPIQRYRKERFDDDITKYANKETTIGYSIAPGYPSGTMASQLTEMDWDLPVDELIYAWFGAACAVGFGGGVDLLFDDEEILSFIGKGWKYYREYMNGLEALKSRQIETWNGLWLHFGYAKRDDTESAFEILKDGITSQNLTTTTGNIIKLDRIDWANQILTMAGKQKDGLALTAYAYNLGQTNETYGFLQIDIPAQKRMLSIWERLLSREEQSKKASQQLDLFAQARPSKAKRALNKNLEKVYKTQYSLRKAASFGQLGLRAMTPKDLYKFTGYNERSGKDPFKTFYKLDKEEKRILLNTYKTWLIAMLNNEETLELTEKLAECLHAYEAGGTSRLTTRLRKVEELWKAEYRQKFLDLITDIMEEAPETTEALKKVGVAIHMHIPVDKFKYFRTLARFEYVSQKNQS